jgi:hypothetical protein
MTTIPLSLILNRSAIERLTGVPARKITSFELQFDDLVIVTVKPSRLEPAPKPIILELAQLENQFHEFRRDGGRSLVLLTSRTTGRGTIVHQVEGQGADVYLVEESKTHLACTCEDWHQHATVCKHGWCVLHTLQCDSLLELWQLRSQPEPAPVPVAEMRSSFGREKPKFFRGVSID